MGLLNLADRDGAARVKNGSITKGERQRVAASSCHPPIATIITCCRERLLERALHPFLQVCGKRWAHQPSAEAATDAIHDLHNLRHLDAFSRLMRWRVGPTWRMLSQLDPTRRCHISSSRHPQHLPRRERQATWVDGGLDSPAAALLSKLGLETTCQMRVME